jgi:glycosyltransferase involved in cell wall biosynthesis
MGNLKILWFNWRCWLNPAMGGAEVFTREVAKHWVSKNQEVTLFTSMFPGCKKEEVSEGVTIVRDGGRFSVYHKAKKAYERIFSKQDFDIVIDEINTIPFFAPKFVKNARVFALIHQLAREYWYYETPFPINYLGYHHFENKWLQLYLKIPTVTVSKSTQNDLTKLGFKNIRIVPEGLGFDPLPIIPKKDFKPIIVFAGRLKHTKRPDHAIKAFKLIKEKIPDAQLWIIGDGPFKCDLESMASKGVTFFGNVNNSTRRDLIKNSAVLVNPGIREGWGLNIIEANALGVPAVAYNVPGLCDSVKDNETGLLAKDDFKDLADKIIDLLTDQRLLERFSRNALEYSKEFSWNKTAEEFLSFLNEVV